MSPRAPIVLFGVVLLGCAGAEPTPAPPAAPSSVLASIAPAPPPGPAVDLLRTVDEQGHLLPAEALIQSFEVPRGLVLLRRTHEAIEFELDASEEQVAEFYSGLERETGRRFGRRRYAVAQHKVGLDVRHTEETIERLKLDPRHRTSEIYVGPGRGRRQTLRFRGPIEDRESALDAAPTDAPPASGSGRDTLALPSGGTAPGTSPTSAGSAGNAGDTPTESPPTANGTPPSESTPRSPVPRDRAGAPHCPLAPGQRRDASAAIREWQSKNPGQRFLD